MKRRISYQTLCSAANAALMDENIDTTAVL